MVSRAYRVKSIGMHYLPLASSITIVSMAALSITLTATLPSVGGSNGIVVAVNNRSQRPLLMC